MLHGEEVYSLAIALLEYLHDAPNGHPIQIFGSDVSEKAVERARAGTYPDSALRDVSNERRNVRIRYAAQIGVAPPTFVFFTNVATTFHFSYERFLVNRLREEFGFVGTPIRVQVRRRRS